MRTLLAGACLSLFTGCAKGKDVQPVSTTDRGKLEQHLRERGLGRVAPRLLALARPRYRLRRASGEPRPRSSHLGGTPDLPPSTPWPQWHGKALAFLAQVRLKDLPVEPDLGLPAAGCSRSSMTRSSPLGASAPTIAAAAE